MMNDRSFEDPIAADYLNDFVDDDDGGRSSGESSAGFATAINLRKNLASSFEEQIGSASSSSSVVVSRIAHFEQQAAVAVAAPASSHTRPPLAAARSYSSSTNVIPANQLAVYLRIRPSQEPPTIEVLQAKPPHVHPTSVRTYPPTDSQQSKSHRDTCACAKQFDFTQVLDASATQVSVYNTIARPLLQDLMNNALHPKAATTNQSALLFSYGITNAGKTHTILGGDLKSHNQTQWGIIPRTIQDILDRIAKRPTGNRVDLYMSFFEIYQEQVFDLVPKKKQTPMPPVLKVGERNGQTIVRGLTKHKIRDVQHGVEVTMAANNRRHTSSNNLNSDSSRSHCVCQLQLVQREDIAASNKVDDDESSVVSTTTTNGYSTDDEVVQQSKTSTIWIVDLAGSERSKRVVSMARQKEASQINKSLMTLMRCLTVMRQSSNSNAVVPFRESKLTHVFMGHLTGPCAARTAMIVNVHPSRQDFDETQHVLAYASSAKLIKIDREQLLEKRKQYFGNEYEMNGRRVVVKKENAWAKMARKLSPKKLLQKWSPKKPKAVVIDKRKHDSSHPRPPLSKQSSNASLNSTTSTTTGDEPAYKRRRAETMNKGTSTKTEAPVVEGPMADADIQAAQDALKLAQAKIQALERQNQELLQELANQESQIRSEVAEEMEERLLVTRQRHARELERLREQQQQQEELSPSTRKAQLEKASETIDTLLDKVDEAESELERLRKHHSDQVAKLQAAHEAELAVLQDKVAGLEKKLEASSSRNQAERLAPSQDTRKEETKAFDEDDGVDDDMPLWKQKLLRKRKVLGNVGNVPSTKKQQMATKEESTRITAAKVRKQTVL